MAAKILVQYNGGIKQIHQETKTGVPSKHNTEPDWWVRAQNVLFIGLSFLDFSQQSRDWACRNDHIHFHKVLKTLGVELILWWDRELIFQGVMDIPFSTMEASVQQLKKRAFLQHFSENLQTEICLRWPMLCSVNNPISFPWVMYCYDSQ